MSDKEIINICRIESEDVTNAIAVTSKAHKGFEAFSQYIEQSTNYDDRVAAEM